MTSLNLCSPAIQMAPQYIPKPPRRLAIHNPLLFGIDLPGCNSAEPTRARLLDSYWSALASPIELAPHCCRCLCGVKPELVGEFLHAEADISFGGVPLSVLSANGMLDLTVLIISHPKPSRTSHFRPQPVPSTHHEHQGGPSKRPTQPH